MPANNMLRRSLIEGLETRRLMHGSLDVSINFAPKRVPGVEGMIPDVGNPYGDRGDGLFFGWNASNSANHRDRNVLADQRLDTNAMLQVGGNKRWEFAVPTGDYLVTVTAGDARYVDSVNVINVEGSNVVKTTPSKQSPFNTKSRVVTVTDGKLTVRAGSGAQNAKIVSIRIQSTHGDDGHPAETPSVSVTAPDATAAEGDTDTGLIRLTRTGDAAASLTVNLAWSGSAGKKDISSPRPTSVTFSAGQTVIDLPVVAKVDALDENPEAAWATVVAGSGYTIGSPAAAAVVVSNTAAPVPSVSDITWTATTQSLLPHTEGQADVIDGKLYRFGGYYGNYSATRRVERFDLATQTWTQMADSPVGMSHAGNAVVGGTTVWFAGGYNERVGFPGLQDIGVRNVFIYDSVANTWSTGPQLPEARGSGAMANVGGVLYFISGARDGDRADMTTVWAYDTNNPGAGWVTKAPIPEARSHFAAVAVGTKIYCFGGQTGHDAGSVMLKTTYVYDTVADTWTRKADMPTPMSHLAPASVAYRGKIYSFGGDNPVNVASSQAREYDPATDTWRLLSNLPVPRAALVAGVVGDQFVISGGKDHAEWTRDTFVGTIVA